MLDLIRKFAVGSVFLLVVMISAFVTRSLYLMLLAVTMQSVICLYFIAYLWFVKKGIIVPIDEEEINNGD